MIYKGYKIERGLDCYFVSKDNEQIYPNDDYQPISIKECKELINKQVNRKK